MPDTHQAHGQAPAHRDILPVIFAASGQRNPQRSGGDFGISKTSHKNRPYDKKAARQAGFLSPVNIAPSLGSALSLLVDLL